VVVVGAGERKGLQQWRSTQTGLVLCRPVTLVMIVCAGLRVKRFGAQDRLETGSSVVESKAIRIELEAKSKAIDPKHGETAEAQGSSRGRDQEEEQEGR
jgi:hypothetical protein